MPIFTSPFPTTHDTIGASTLDSPTPGLPSPASVVRPHHSADGDQREDKEEEEEQTIHENDNENAAKEKANNKVSPDAPAPIDLDQKLAQISIDWNKFPGAKKHDGNDAPEEEEDQEPEFGGPEDLTMNLDKYLLGDLDLKEQQQRHDQINDQFEEDDDLPDSPSPLPRQHHDAEVSEFEPPLDMSTPSHLMWKKNPGTNREETHLEDILESFPSSPEKSASPTKNNDHEEEMGRSRTFTTVLREIEDLHEQRRERDERIQVNQEKLASANAEIEYLRAELQRKSSQLSDANAKVGEEAVLREQIQILKKKLDEKIFRDENVSDQLTLLREQLDNAQEQLKQRDEALEDGEKHMRENAAAQEQQLRERDAEIEDLKAQASERELELANLDEELAEAKQEYAVLEQRIGAIETRNVPLEEKNILLEKEVNRVKSELVAQRNSLSIMATDLNIETDGKTYNEVIESLKKQFKTKQPASQDTSAEETTENLRTKLAEAQAEAKQSAAAQQAAEKEWKQSQETLTESRALITKVESENTRLTTRLHELNSNLSTVREELRALKEQRVQPKSPPTPPPQDPSAALLEASRLEIKNLNEAHAIAVDNLRSFYNDSVTNLRSLLSASEKREADLHSQLSSLHTTITARHEKEVSELKAQIDDLQSTLSVKEETSAEVDRRISQAIEKREREWERRINLLLKEREKMSKALMVAWGEKEVGKSSKTSSSSNNGGAGRKDVTTSERRSETGTGKQGQGYRYKYVVRS